MSEKVDESKLIGEFDAQVWAREFMKLIHNGTQISEGLMIGWFANAIMSGYDRGLDHCSCISNEQVTDERH